MLLLEQFLAGEQYPKPVAEVDAPELGPGGKVYLRELPLDAVLRLHELQAATAGDGPDALRAKADAVVELFARSACKADGTPLLPDGPLSDAHRARVRSLPQALLARVAEAVGARAGGDGADEKKGSGPTTS